MKVLDRYVTRELAIPIIYSCVSLVFLILISDLFNSLDDFLRNHTPFRVIAKYYLCLIPYAFTQTVAWATWLGSLFLLVNFGFHNETTAMKAVGLKITTIVRPMLFLGLLVGVAVFLINDRIVPRTYRITTELQEIHIAKKQQASRAKEKIYRNVTYSEGSDKLYYFRVFSRKSEEVQDAIVLWLATEGENSRKKMTARKGLYTPSGWKFENVTEYQMDSRGRILGDPRLFAEKTFPDMTFTPKELANASSDSPLLTYKELKQSIRKLKDNGVNVTSENVDLQQRLATPWQGLVMMLMTIPLLAKTTNRKAIALNVLVCVGLAFAYHVTGAVGVALGKAGKFYPFLGAWIANILFTVGALTYLDRSNF